MSFGIGLQRLGASGVAAPKNPTVLEDIRAAIQVVLAMSGIAEDTIMGDDGQSFTVTVPGGTAKIHANHAIFPVERLDRLWLQLVYATAKAGDMAVVGDDVVVLTDSAQPRPTWLLQNFDVAVCSSPEELGIALDRWYRQHHQYTEGMRRDLDSQNVQRKPALLPGTLVDAQRGFLYIEARPDETAAEHLAVIGKRYRLAHRDNPKDVPGAGSMAGTAWRLRTPDGKAFYGIAIRGEKKAWFAALRAYASIDGRSIGEIVNCDTFVLDDGCSVPLVACAYEKVHE